MTGSGKTTFVNRYLASIQPEPACRFIFDDLSRMFDRLKVRPCFTDKELEASLASHWSAFVAWKMQAAKGWDTKTVFRHWCKWVFDCSKRGPGKKMVCIPEVWRHCNPDSIPQELALLIQAGRELGIETITDTQHPERLNASITGAATEIVAFRLQDPKSLRSLQTVLSCSGISADVAEVSALPLGSFIAWNRLSGGRLAGTVF